MNLQEIFYGTFVPPISTKSVIHKIGLSSNSNRYVPPTQKPEKQKKEHKSSLKVLQIMQKIKHPMSPMDMSKKTNWTRNHCNIIMCALWKQKLLKRHMVKKGNTRNYIYELVETSQ